MKKLILEKDLVNYIEKLLSGVDNLHCCEEYRAGYVEALNEILISIPQLAIPSGSRHRRESFSQH